MNALVVLLLSMNSYAAKMDSEYIDFSKLKLSNYIAKSNSNQKVEKMDTNGSGKPDTFFVFEEVGDGKRDLKMHLFDLNGDGKIDLAKHFVLGKMVKSEADLDFDEYADVVTEYDPKTGDVLKKTQSDGKTNIWRYWHEGQLRLKEMDRNSDKKPDIWVYYRGGKAVKTEVDVDFDGKNIRVQKTE